jgi:predicted Zn-ribbon and HTH transcriptional regulator
MNGTVRGISRSVIKNSLPMYCVRCDNLIPDLVLKSNEKEILSNFVRSDKNIHAVRFLIEAKKVSHRESKIYVDHITPAFGKCVRCEYDKLSLELQVCPKCNSANINWE